MNINRLHNLKNPYQGNAKKVLCVCSAGLLRSPTAANVLHREFGYNTRAAGLTEEYALIVADAPLMMWADEIVCMEKWMEVELDSYQEANGKVKCLNVPDNFAFMDPTLQKLIIQKYKEQQT